MNQRFSTRHHLTPLILVLTFLLSSQAEARSYPPITYGAEYIQTWDDNCYPGASLNWLYYTKNSIEFFAAAMKKYGHTQAFVFSNTNAEATDLKESSQESANHDSDYADRNELFAYAGHGGANSDFLAHLCINKSRGFSNYERRVKSLFRSNDHRWGETDDSTPGNMRWAIMDTCHSVPPHPHKVWKKTFGPRFEYLLGFRHYSVFVATTDETLEDWAENVFDDGDTFQSGWFDAVEDWFISAMDGSVLSVGDTTDEALNRLRNQTANYPSRRSTTRTPNHFAWSWTNTFSRIHTYTDNSTSFGD